MLYEPINLDLPAGGTYTKDIVISGTPNLFITVQKVVIPGGSSGLWLWNGKVALIKNGTEIASSSSYGDILLQNKNLEPGIYTVAITADRPASGILEIRTALPELPAEEWVVESVYHNIGSVFNQIEVPPDRIKSLSKHKVSMMDISWFIVIHIPV